MDDNKEMTDKQALSKLIKAQALGVGFDLAGITRLGPAETADAFDDWLSRGYAGEMSYLPRGAELSRGSAIKRAKRSGFLRNVAVALGNSGSPEAIPALTDALSDEEPLVREHAAWAFSRLGSPEPSGYQFPIAGNR